MRPRAPGLRGRRFLLPWVVGAVAPVGLAMAWIPLRTHQSDVDIALLLVVVVAATGLFGQRGPVALAAVAAAVSFDAFDTAPYGTLAISRSQDLLTTVVLALVGASGGELGIRLVRTRRSPTAPDGFSRVRKAASLVAQGEEAVLVVGSVGQEISRLLNLRECLFEAGDPPTGMAQVSRDGVVITPASPLSPAGTPSPAELALPVWSSGRPIGFYRLTPAASDRFALDALTVAVTLADQVGAALSVFEAPAASPGEAGPNTTEPDPGRYLRLLR